MRPAERPFLREFNKSPFIKFPIKDNVSSTAHKISLMIQIQLGGIEHPAEKEFTMIRRQFNTEKSIIFDRIQRLIRCVVDCKADDRDAVAARHALDLARSLSAEFWENSNLQLRQISGIGPAAVRKLVSNDVNSIEKLAGKDTASIERILTKNPPYGRKLLDSLSGFPRLSLISEITGKAPNRQGQNPKVNVRAIIKYLNFKIPVWMGKKPSLTLMAETTDGFLIHFWRGNIIKLERGTSKSHLRSNYRDPMKRFDAGLLATILWEPFVHVFLNTTFLGQLSHDELSLKIFLKRRNIRAPLGFKERHLIVLTNLEEMSWTMMICSLP
jgi:ATP-dependent DNA helicase HFM1/MER3